MKARTVIALAGLALMGCAVAPATANMFVSQPIDSLLLRVVRDGSDSVELGWSIRYGKPSYSGIGGALGLTPTSLGTSRSEGSFTFSVRSLGEGCPQHAILYDGVELARGETAVGTGIRRQRIDKAELRATLQLRPSPECAIAVYGDFDDSDSRVGCTVRAITAYGEEVAAVQLPREPRLTNAEKWRDLAWSPFGFVVGTVELVLIALLLPFARF